MIEGFDAEQMGDLLRAADALPGKFLQNGIDRNLWWVAFLLTAWATGLRLGDLLAIKRESIKPIADGFGISIVMSKTGRVIHRPLPACVVEAIDRLMSVGRPREVCFPLWSTQRNYYYEFKQIASEAGLSGTTKYIRRGSASEIEAMRAGSAQYHLGHKTSGLFETSYRVNRIVQRDIPAPPMPAFTPTLRIENKPAKGGAA